MGNPAKNQIINQKWGIHREIFYTFFQKYVTLSSILRTCDTAGSMIPRENGGPSEHLTTSPMLCSPVIEPTDDKIDILHLSILTEEIAHHDLVVGVVSFTKAWEEARGTDNLRKCQVSVPCSEHCSSWARVLSSSASAFKARLTKVAVLADLLAKLDVHANAEKSTCVTFVQARRLASSAGAAIAGPASIAEERKRPNDACSRLMQVARLRQDLAKATATASSVHAKMQAIERRLLEELEPLRLTLEQTELKVKLIQDELTAVAPSKQRRRAEPQPLQPPDEPQQLGPSAIVQPWSLWPLSEFRRQQSMHHTRMSLQLSDAVAMPLAERRLRGADGPLSHSRWGLVGALQYWAAGSTEYAAHLAMELISRLELTDRMRDLLGDKEKKARAAAPAYRRTRQRCTRPRPGASGSESQVSSGCGGGC